MAALVWIGYLCYLFALVDFIAYWCGYDITGVSWSPFAAVILGTILCKIGGEDED